ncbi:Peo1 [Acrasis kona]|uniref:Peo1 n=1 Tax=Acrasis kona TaxID=1008807 RepID=A0AAW2ZSB7_9EUKA
MYNKKTEQHYVVKDCPECHNIKNEPSNQYKLYISRASGAFICHRCGVKGSWFDFKNKLDDGHVQITKYETKPTNAEDLNVAQQKVTYQHNLLNSNNSTKQYLIQNRGITAETLQKYQVGTSQFKFLIRNEQTTSSEWKVLECVTFPMSRLDSHSKIQYTKHKIRSITNKSAMKMEPSGTALGLFGYHTIPLNATQIVITEGEYDAMAVHQCTGLPAISLPNGCRSLPVDLLPLLEKFTKIYLWMDDDIPGQQGAEKFAKKLGVSRCFIVHSNLPNQQHSILYKDANDVLLKSNIDMNELIKQAKVLPHDRIMTYGDLKNDVYREMFGMQDGSKPMNGVQSTTLPRFVNQILKGHRRGELTILTGPTGIGKTTLLSQLAIDFASQGVNTLWGSFEIKNVRLIKKMLCQYMGAEQIHERNFNEASQQFEQLPQHFMNFYGTTNVDQVLDAMEYAVYVNDVHHVLIDNLQFMLSGQGTGIERFENMDRAVEKFRKFATQHNVHITLVVHPRKVDDGHELGLSSVFGSAKATQEADNVIIIQNAKDHRFLSVKKNRFDGTIGNVPYRFDKESNRMIELTEEQVERLKAGQLEITY